jgi:hypothetical protein
MILSRLQWVGVVVVVSWSSLPYGACGISVWCVGSLFARNVNANAG